MSKASPHALEKLRKNWLDDSELDLNYLALTAIACIIATIGLLSNSAAVIVVAMIIAPLMLPVRGLALGALQRDLLRFRQSAIALSWSVRRAMNLPASEFTPEILARTQPTLAGEIDKGFELDTRPD